MNMTPIPKMSRLKGRRGSSFVG